MEHRNKMTPTNWNTVPTPWVNARGGGGGSEEGGVATGPFLGEELIREPGL
jgi:hypothetical protein